MAAITETTAPAQPAALPLPVAADERCSFTWGSCYLTRMTHYCVRLLPCPGHFCTYCGATP